MNGVQLIAAERQRQIEDEKFSGERDDKYKKNELLLAADSYLATVATPDEYAAERGTKPAPCHDWPWAKSWWKPSADPVRNLVKAGALIAAEIDRLQRAKAKDVKIVNGGDHYQFNVTARYANGTMVARCNGKTASCTSSARIAAENAAQKAFEALCQNLCFDPKTYLRGSVSVGGEHAFVVNFTKLP